MSRLPSPHRRRTFGLLALVLIGTSAQAADFDGAYRPRPDFGRGFEEDYGRRPPPPPPPRFPRFSAGPDLAPSPCRVFVKRRFDADGEPVIRRVRVCDEPDDLGPPRRPRFDPPPPPEFPDEPRSRWGGPRW